MVGVEDRLWVLAARPWAMSSDEVVSLLDDIQQLAVEVEAARLAAVREIDARAVQRRDIGGTPQDKLLALSTCADAETNGRVVVFGRLCPINEGDERP